MMILTTLPSPVGFSPLLSVLFPCISLYLIHTFCFVLWTVILELLVQQWIWNYPLEPGWLPMGIWLKTMTASVSGFVKRHSLNPTSIHDWQLASSFFIVLVRWVAIWYHDCNGYVCPKWQHFIAYLHIISLFSVFPFF